MKAKFQIYFSILFAIKLQTTKNVQSKLFQRHLSDPLDDLLPI